MSAFHALPGRPDAPVVLTCEHASEHLPEPWRWPDADRRLLGTHWSHDLGAAALVHALAEVSGWPAILCGFTRLLVDPNRGPEQDGLFRSEADGVPVALNAAIEPAERALRMGLHEAYHAACDAMVAARPGAMVFSIHSFTPLYEGQRREMELGVLYNHHEAPAIELADRLAAAGWQVALNAPWSGRAGSTPEAERSEAREASGDRAEVVAGLMYAADRHSEAHGRIALELEVRQDLLADPGVLQRLVGDLAAFLPGGT